MQYLMPCSVCRPNGRVCVMAQFLIIMNLFV